MAHVCRKMEKNTVESKTYSSNNINDGDFLLWVVLVLQSSLFSDQSPQLVQVYCWHVVLVLADMEVPHTNLKMHYVVKCCNILIEDIKKEVQQDSTKLYF